MAYQGYEYETSPRKLQPEYKTEKVKKQTRANKNQKEQQNVSVEKNKNKSKIKTLFYIAIGFTILFAMCYQNSLITEEFNKKEKLKTELAGIEKENEQLKINIEKTLNLNNVEQMAKEKLGMQKLSNSQKIYISLPKKDYVESSKEETFEENESLITKVLGLFK